jgi:cytochrome c peroxidase
MRKFFHVMILGLMNLSTVTQAAFLDIAIDPRFDGEALRLDSLRYQTSAGETISITRLSYLISGLALETEDGRWLEFPAAIAWMDAAAHRNRFTIPDVPPANYRGIRFHIGLDPTTNAADPAVYPASHPLNPNLNGLHWSWQGGYIFMAVEGMFITPANSALKGYAHHLARDANRTGISLSCNLDCRKDSGVLIHFDLAALFNAPRPLSFEKDGSSTHSRQGDSIAAALVSNLPGAFRIRQLVSPQAAATALPRVAPIDFPATVTPYRFVMSGTFPIPELPRDNPLIVERVELGRRLFHETALSRDNTISCTTCHQADAAFTDGRKVSHGIDGRMSERNAMPLFNLAWKRTFFWDGRAPSLREQVVMPIRDHREMDQSLESASARLKDRSDYWKWFQAAFKSGEISGETMALALEQFLLTLSARSSRFDQAMSGKASLNEAEKRGFELFMTEYEPRTGQYGADCFHCHGGALFTDHQFHNNGLAGNDPGRAGVTGLDSDQRKFSTPSLRNIAVTAPYMHDGRFATLEEVVEHYSSGIQRSATLDPNLAKHPATGLKLSTEDKCALVAFLKTLTAEPLAK